MPELFALTRDSFIYLYVQNFCMSKKMEEVETIDEEDDDWDDDDEEDEEDEDSD